VPMPSRCPSSCVATEKKSFLPLICAGSVPKYHPPLGLMAKATEPPQGPECAGGEAAARLDRACSPSSEKHSTLRVEPPGRPHRVRGIAAGKVFPTGEYDQCIPGTFRSVTCFSDDGEHAAVKPGQQPRLRPHSVPGAVRSPLPSIPAEGGILEPTPRKSTARDDFFSVRHARAGTSARHRHSGFLEYVRFSGTFIGAHAERRSRTGAPGSIRNRATSMPIGRRATCRRARSQR